MSGPTSTYAEHDGQVVVETASQAQVSGEGEHPVTTQRRTRRRWRLPFTLVGVGLAAGLLAGGAWWAFAPAPPEEPAEPVVAEEPVAGDEVVPAQRFAEAPSAPDEELVPDAPNEPADAAPAPASPVRVAIPAIDVDAEVVDVGLLPDGAMEVPDFGLAGWYELGPKPGEVGPAVIAAHVDSRDGPDVFFRLDELEAGDEIHVEDADGRVETFTVTSSELTPKDELPTERIWSSEDAPVLRLITCGGEFDRSARSYLSNTIVYADHAG